MNIIKRIYRILFPPMPLTNYELMREKINEYRMRGAIIGNHVRLWGYIDSVNPQLVTIGNCVCVSTDTYLITHCPVNPGSILIEDNVWIGFRSIVLPNVTIGQNSLIGAGSVVTHNIPPNSIACGNPAKVIGQRKQDELINTIYCIKNDLPFGKVE